jgi:hypothetical protein
MAITPKMLGARGRRQAQKLGNGYNDDADPWREQRHWF